MNFHWPQMLVAAILLVRLGARLAFGIVNLVIARDGWGKRLGGAIGQTLWDGGTALVLSAGGFWG